MTRSTSSVSAKFGTVRLSGPQTVPYSTVVQQSVDDKTNRSRYLFSSILTALIFNTSPYRPALLAISSRLRFKRSCCSQSEDHAK